MVDNGGADGHSSALGRALNLDTSPKEIPGIKLLTVITQVDDRSPFLISPRRIRLEAPGLPCIGCPLVPSLL